MGQRGTATVTKRRHKGFYGNMWGFDCPQGFAPFTCEIGAKAAAERAANLYNARVEFGWSFWPIEETVLIESEQMAELQRAC